jgi:eukaryotic-like serine/threonine-protein kinase
MVAPLKPGSVIDGRFVLEAEAKRGGMGTVWRAHDRRSKQLVACKLLHDRSPEQCRRFVREQQLLADLTHPNIVSYVAHGSIKNEPYLVMEWLDGENLAERILRAPLTLHETLSVLRSTLAGLAFAHRRGIVHRDLKPSNLFLRAGKPEETVLLDLGLARQLGSEASGLTRTGAILGTPSYMAPEQAQGERDVTSAADIFSLGCILFECLTGAPPFVGTQLLTVLAKILFQPTPRLSEARPDLPAHLDTLLAHMLEKDPSKRARDADALSVELQNIGPMPSLQAPSAPARTSAVEQELVGVILASDAAGHALLEAEAETLQAHTPSSDWSEVVSFGGELKRMANGTSVVVVAQRGGAATDLSARTARCALYMRRCRPELQYAFTTGRGFAHEHSYLGDAVERAGGLLRAAATAAAGSIWLDETTADLLDQRFRRTRVAPQAFALDSEADSVDPARPLLGRPTPCVGRERELAMLALSLGACIDERSPQAMLVLGPAGIGKSRLRHEFLRRAQQEHEVSVLLAFGDPIRSAASGGMVGQALARACELRADASPADNHAQLAAHIKPLLVTNKTSDDPELTLTFLAELCGLPELQPTRVELRAARQNPTVMVERLTQSWLAFLRARASERPTVIVLDDLQWSDARSIALIEASLRLPDAPLLVLALGRPETAELFPALWSPHLTSLPLPPLAASATRRLIREVLGADIGDARVERIVSGAGGNALYLEELIRATEGGLESTPPTVLAMLQARIGLLPPAARRVLRAASVLGEHFSSAGVAALTGDPPSELDVQLSLLTKQELLDPQAGAQLRFRHVLLRDAAYALLTEEDRLANHLAAAQHLQNIDDDPAVIGAHCERGGEPRTAVQHYMRAIKHAHQRNDSATTLALIARCESLAAAGPELGMLRSLESMSRFVLHDMSGAWDAAQAALELIPKGHAGRLHAVTTASYVALQIGRMSEVTALIDEMLVGEPTPDEAADWAQAIGFATIAWITQADRARSSRLLARMLEIEGSSRDDDVLVHGQISYWQVRFEVLLGADPAATLQIARAGVVDLERVGDMRIACAMWVEIGECTRRAYSLPSSIDAFRKGVELARAFGERVSLAFVSTYLANALAALGTREAVEEARALSEEIIELTAEGSAYRALGHVSSALAALALGDIPAALQHAQIGRSSVHALGMRAYYPHFDDVLIRALVASGDATDAASVAHEALENVDSYGPLGMLEPSLRTAAARALLMAAEHERAKSEVERSLQLLHARLSTLSPEERTRACWEVPENAELLRLATELQLPFALG